MPFVPGTVRGKKWMPPPRPEPATSSKDDEKVELDIEGMEGDVEVALNAASTDEIVDLAGILGLHSMMNQVCISAAHLDSSILGTMYVIAFHPLSPGLGFITKSERGGF